MNINKETINELSVGLSIKIWERWHGPMARIPATHEQCVNELIDMINEVCEYEKYEGS